jgi:hypothetical protein
MTTKYITIKRLLYIASINRAYELECLSGAVECFISPSISIGWGRFAFYIQYCTNTIYIVTREIIPVPCRQKQHVH